VQAETTAPGAKGTIDSVDWFDLVLCHDDYDGNTAAFTAVSAVCAASCKPVYITSRSCCLVWLGLERSRV